MTRGWAAAISEGRSIRSGARIDRQFTRCCIKRRLTKRAFKPLTFLIGLRFITVRLRREMRANHQRALFLNLRGAARRIELCEACMHGAQRTRRRLDVT